MDWSTKVGVVVAISASPYAFFKVLEESASQSAKLTLGSWLSKTEFTKDRTAVFHTVVQGMVLGIFGNNPFRLSFIWRSSILTIIGSAVVLATTYCFDYHNKDHSAKSLLVSIPDLTTLAAAYVETILFALFTDYLSLAKTVILMQTEICQRFYIKAFFFDIAISFFLAFGWALALVIVVYKVYGHNSADAHFTYWVGFCLFTSLIPTIFTLSLSAAALVAKLVVYALKPAQWMKKTILDIENKPFISTGILLVPFATVVGLATVIAGTTISS